MALTAQDIRELKKIFVTKQDLKESLAKATSGLATIEMVADLKAEMMEGMGRMASKEDLENAVQEIIQVVSDAFSSVPNRVEFHGLERRVGLLEHRMKLRTK